MIDIYDQLSRLRLQNKSFALVTVVSTKGSTPRDTGSKMIVCADGEVHGTIGGSAVEAMVIEEAQASIQSGKCLKIWHDLDDSGKKDTGMICGGKMEFFIEPIGTQPHLYIFGGGHVAYPLAKIAFQVGFSYSIVEDREEFASKERFTEAREIIVSKPEEIAEKIKFDPTDYVAIVTRSHEMDYQALKVILEKKLKYIGLIASKVKKKQVVNQLLEDGFDEKVIKQIHSPIGLDIGAETPVEIAVAIMAEIINLRRGGRAISLSDALRTNQRLPLHPHRAAKGIP